MNEDKIKVLERAIEYLQHNRLTTGICDALSFSCGTLPGDPRFYGIILPPRKYKFLGWPAFAYPLTTGGKITRINVLKKAIKKLQS